MIAKPNILSVIAQRIELRRVGKEYVGLCPFHNDRRPSLYVNETKQVFLCRSCREHGDVIEFVRKLYGVNFFEALAYLGIDLTACTPKPVDTRKRRAAAMLAGWMNDQHLRVGAMLRERSRSIAIAEETNATTLVKRFEREFSILEILFDDLQRPEYAAELWAARDTIERITAHAPVEPIDEFPACTPEYREFLRENLPEGPC